MNMTWGFTNNPAPLDDVLNCVGPGWHGIIRRLITDLATMGWDGTVMQVKEKFGGLRFYIGASNDDVFERVSKAEIESYDTCETCGEPGTSGGDGWITTRCVPCRAKDTIRLEAMRTAQYAGKGALANGVL